MIEQDVCI